MGRKKEVSGEPKGQAAIRRRTVQRYRESRSGVDTTRGSSRALISKAIPEQGGVYKNREKEEGCVGSDLLLGGHGGAMLIMGGAGRAKLYGLFRPVAFRRRAVWNRSRGRASVCRAGRNTCTRDRAFLKRRERRKKKKPWDVAAVDKESNP